MVNVFKRHITKRTERPETRVAVNRELSAEIWRLVTEHAKLQEPLRRLHDTSDLYAAGMSSISSVDLMLALEEKLDVDFPNEMLVRETFASVSAIAEAVDHLRSGGPDPS